MRIVLAIGLMLAAAAPAAGQQEGPCTYDSCALLRVESRVLAGARRAEVASFGTFGPPDVREMFASSEEASRLLDVTEANYRSGRILELIGVVALAGASFAFATLDQDDESPTTAQWLTYGVGLGLGGVGLRLWGHHRVRRARRAFDEAMWWYNASLAGPDPR